MRVLRFELIFSMTASKIKERSYWVLLWVTGGSGFLLNSFYIRRAFKTRVCLWWNDAL